MARKVSGNRVGEKARCRLAAYKTWAAWHELDGPKGLPPNGIMNDLCRLIDISVRDRHAQKTSAGNKSHVRYKPGEDQKHFNQAIHLVSVKSL